jgi:hypothetical protein
VQHILNYLKEPSWWFSAGVVGFLASLAAAFIKDWISARLSSFSTRYRRYRLRKLRRSARTIRNIATDPGYMVFFVVQLVSLLMFGYLLLITYLGATQHPYLGKPFWLITGLRLFMLAVPMFIVFNIPHQIRELTRGLRRYKRRRGLYD